MADDVTDATATATAPTTQPSTNGAAANGHVTDAPQAPPAALPNELPPPLTTALELPSDFEFNEVDAKKALTPPATPALGPLAHFKGTFTGNGFNTIFRPDNTVTPTVFPTNPVVGPNDNVLELNLTQETLSFQKPLGTVPNRGFVQGDAFLNGVGYLQTINDVTTGSPVGIHFEPGLWVIVPQTKDPKEGSTLTRMASIPHGTTINAQGTFAPVHNGPPTINPVDITPVPEGGSGPITFPSQTAATGNTRRIPQDLSTFITNGTITQAILSDPNTVLREAIAGLDITETVKILITTDPTLPLFGGGTDNIAFLWGDKAAVTSAAPSGQNAQAAKMRATFWIETVQRTIHVPVQPAGTHSVKITPAPTAGSKRQPVPSFQVHLAHPLTAPVDIKVTYTQIQYSQLVILNFNGLSWPHASVATLVPDKPIAVQAN